jgi:hypothetical protein
MIAPSPEGLIEVDDMIKMEKILLKSLITISKSIEQPHRDKRRELLRAKND